MFLFLIPLLKYGLLLQDLGPSKASLFSLEEFHSGVTAAWLLSPGSPWWRISPHISNSHPIALPPGGESGIHFYIKSCDCTAPWRRNWRTFLHQVSMTALPPGGQFLVTLFNQEGLLTFGEKISLSQYFPDLDISPCFFYFNQEEKGGIAQSNPSRCEWEL